MQVVTVMLEVEPSTQNMGTCLMWQTREAQLERSTRVERISNSFTTHLLNIVWNGVGFRKPSGQTARPLFGELELSRSERRLHDFAR